MNEIFRYGDFVDYLKDVYRRRAEGGADYTRTQFAVDLGLTHNRLSEIMNRKRGVSKPSARKMAASLGLTGEGAAYFCDLVEAKHARSKEMRMTASRRAEATRTLKVKYVVISQDEFAAISEWYHFAITEALKIESARTVEGVAALLRLPEKTVDDALRSLERHGLVERRPDGTFGVLVNSSAVPSGPAHDVIKDFHEKQLQRARVALRSQKLEDVEFQSLTVAVARADIPKFRRRLQNLVKELGLELAQPEPKTSVYHFGMQFFELKD
jgi:uncharacterized protein (TIGR02147 family)